MKSRKTLAFLVVLAVGVGAGFGLRSVFADGIRSPNPLYYSGTLTEGGKLVNDTRAITINLWPDGTTQGSPLCTTVASSPPAQVVNGRFRIALASSCKQVINANNNAYVEVIDGATSLGRTPMGAVPYAVEADHAVSATNAVDGGGIAVALSSLQQGVTSLQGGLAVASGFMSSDGSIGRQNPQWIQPVPSHTSTGEYTITFQTGFFSSSPDCVVTALSNSAYTADINGENQSGITVYTSSGGTLTNAGFTVVCVGPH